jgi:hypothetical protein
MGRTVRAAGSLRRAARLLTVKAFTRLCTGAARSHPLGVTSGGRRPPAPIGWGSLTVRASFWRPLSRDGLESTGSDPRLRARSPDRDGSLAGRRSRTPPPRQIRRCRRRFRTTATGKTSAPSIGSSRSLAARAGSAALVVHLHCIAPHPVARCEPGAAPSWAAWSPRAIPRSREPPRSGPCCATRKMRLTDFCNRLPSRAPCGLLCFRSRLRADPRLAADRDASSADSPWAVAERREILGRPPCPRSR